MTRKPTPKSSRIHAQFLAALSLAALCSSGLLAQQRPSVRWFPAKQTAEKLQASQPWLSLLNTSTLSLGRYRLSASAKDGQTPHARDEVYHVLSGMAKLRAGDQTRTVATNDSIFVAAGVPHQFVEIEEALDLLVFFSSAKVPSGGMAAGPKPTEQTAYPETSQRGNTRIFYWFGPNSAGQMSIDFGTPRWKKDYTKFMATPSGRRWRLGQNFWTTLDTNIPLTIAGVEVPIGAYYAVLEHSEKNGLQLILLDPSKVRRRRLDAYEANKTKSGISIQLLATKGNRETSKLAIELTIDRSKRDQGSLVIRFGPHELSAALVLKPVR